MIGREDQPHRPYAHFDAKPLPPIAALAPLPACLRPSAGQQSIATMPHVQVPLTLSVATPPTYHLNTAKLYILKQSLTFKMSHVFAWRDTCVSTGRDGQRRWL